MTIITHKSSTPLLGIIDVEYKSGDTNTWFPEQFWLSTERIVNYPTPKVAPENKVPVRPAVKTAATDVDLLLTIQRDLRNLRLAIIDQKERHELLDRTDTLIDHIENTLAEM